MDYKKLKKLVDESADIILENIGGDDFDPTYDEEISHYCIIYDNGHIEPYINRVCHRDLAFAKMGGAHPLLVVDGIYPRNDSQDEENQMWLDYLGERSPMKDAMFMPNHLVDSYETGIAVYNALADANKLSNLAMANRMIHEYPQYPLQFAELVKRGVNEHLAYIFCHNVSAGPDYMQVNSVGPGYHTAVVPHNFTELGVRNFIADRFEEIGSFYDNPTYKNVHTMYSPEWWDAYGQEDHDYEKYPEELTNRQPCKHLSQSFSNNILKRAAKAKKKEVVAKGFFAQQQDNVISVDEGYDIYAEQLKQYEATLHG